MVTVVLPDVLEDDELDVAELDDVCELEELLVEVLHDDVGTVLVVEVDVTTTDELLHELELDVELW